MNSRKRSRLAGVGVVGGLALAGAIAVAGPSSMADTPDESAEAHSLQPTLSCEESRELDDAAAQFASQRRSAIPGPEQYPPFDPEFDPSAPPQPAPLDPTTGKPKGIDAPPLAARPDYSPLARASTMSAASARPCGEVVTKIREEAKQNGAIVCFLADGRYASELMVDAVGEVNPDEVCQHFGYARSDG